MAETCVPAHTVALMSPGAPVRQSQLCCCRPWLQVRERPRLASGAALQWQQLVALTRKNLTARCALLLLLLLGTRLVRMLRCRLATRVQTAAIASSLATSLITMSLCRARAWKTNLLLVAQAVLFIALTWGVDRAGEGANSCTGAETWCICRACLSAAYAARHNCPAAVHALLCRLLAPAKRSVGIQPAQAVVQQR